MNSQKINIYREDGTVSRAVNETVLKNDLARGRVRWDRWIRRWIEVKK